MTHHTTILEFPRQQQQQQKPAQEPCKAAGGGANRWGSRGFEIPKGYVVRNGYAVSAKPVRSIGPRDSEIVNLAVRSFGYLLPMRAVETLAGFATRIELACADAKARAVADTLHRLSA